MRNNKTNFKWFILTLDAITWGSVGAMRMSLPVLFKEISTALNLSLVDIGLIWGMDPLAGVFVSLPAGLLVDRFGLKRTIAVVCILQGIFSAFRGLSVNFASMAAFMFLFGIAAAMTPTLVSKVTAVWFRGANLGLTQALLTIGSAVGSMAGTMLAATFFSPLLGGWRNTIFLYSAPPIIIGFLWIALGREPTKSEIPDAAASAVPFRQAISKVVRIKRVWFIGLIQMCQMGALSGLTGYIPLYLRNIGWTPASADGAMTVLTGISCVGAVPTVLLARRLHSQKRMLSIVTVISAATLGLIPVAAAPAVWAILAINGFLRSGASSLFITMVLETEGIAGTYAGTALGVQFTLNMLGTFLSPPLGNSLADTNAGLPFIFWAALSAAALVALFFIKEQEPKRDVTVYES